MADFIGDIHELRKQIKTVAMAVKAQMQRVDLPEGADVGEIKANVMLTYRHLEDAGMRLGKVIQAADGGVSVYDKGEA